MWISGRSSPERTVLKKESLCDSHRVIEGERVENGVTGVKGVEGRLCRAFYIIVRILAFILKWGAIERRL